LTLAMGCCVRRALGEAWRRVRTAQMAERSFGSKIASSVACWSSYVPKRAGPGHVVFGVGLNLSLRCGRTCRESRDSGPKQ
jgi:hypothetical protein